MSPFAWRSYWNAKITEIDDETMIVVCTTDNHNAYGKTMYLHNTDIFFDETNVRNVGDEGQLCVDGYCAEMADWM